MTHRATRSTLLARLRTRPKALLVALVAAVALLLGPISISLATAAPSMGEHIPCEVSAGMGDHAMIDGEAGAQQHDKSGGCASMQGAVCLSMVGMISPVSPAIGRLPPRLVSTLPVAESVVSHSTSPPHRPPKHV
jgi:hypothetical protein